MLTVFSDLRMSRAYQLCNKNILVHSSLTVDVLSLVKGAVITLLSSNVYHSYYRVLFDDVVHKNTISKLISKH